MTVKCAICNRYFYDEIDLVGHIKESHQTHSIAAIIKYFERRRKRDKSFTEKDIDYIMSFDLERVIDRIIKLEAESHVFYTQEFTDIRTRVINLEMRPEVVCAKDAVQAPPPALQKVQHELNSLKELIFSSNIGVADMPLVPMGGLSQQQIDDRLKWLTHSDKRRGPQMAKVGYGDDHQDLMDELGPILERRYWELE